MNALEARKASEENKAKNLESASKAVMKKIVEAVTKGEHETWVNGPLKPEVVEELKSIGYKIDSFGLETVIRW